MTHILLLSLVYSPDNVSTAQIMAAIAGDLQARDDFDVRVLTTVPHYHRDAGMEAQQPLTWKCWPFLKKSTRDGVPVTHILMPAKSGSKLLWILSWLWFALVALTAGLFLRGRIDAILVCTPPPFIGPCAALLAKFRRARLVYNVQELYPDIAVNLGAIRAGSLTERFFKSLERFTYARCRYVTSITEAMCAKIRTRLPPRKVRLVPNFVDCSETAPDPSHTVPAPHPFTVTYAGNMGVPQKLDLLVEAARLLPEVRMHFIGDGRDKARLQALAKGLDNVVFTDYQPLDRMPAIYAASDLFYVGQCPDACSDGIPSKIYRILGNGRAILAATATDSDMAGFIRESGGGVVVSDFDPASCADAIRRLAADRTTLDLFATRGRAHVLEHYSRAAVSAAYAELLS